MKNYLLRYLFLSIFGIQICSCVSVNIPTSTGTPAKDLKFADVQAPFQEIKLKTADRAWISSQTGNSISLVSECNAAVDTSLTQLENDSLVALNKLKILSTKSIIFNGRESLQTTAEGEVDGVAVKTQTLVFKKNGCNFTLNYGGVRSHFDAELSYFQKFIESFRAP